MADGEADVCDFDPGYEVTGTVETSLRTLTRIWRGDVSWSDALLDGSVTVSEPADVRRSIPTSAWPVVAVGRSTAGVKVVAISDLCTFRSAHRC